jgi:hypothetical protein
MHTVSQLHSFDRAASAAGMDEEEIDALCSFLGANPMAGDEIKGTGGCRKLRWARPGMGKRGGYRVITFYSGVTVPVTLITVFGKGERADLDQKERNDLKKLTKVLLDEYGKRVRKVGA